MNGGGESSDGGRLELRRHLFVADLSDFATEAVIPVNRDGSENEGGGGEQSRRGGGSARKLRDMAVMSVSTSSATAAAQATKKKVKRTIVPVSETIIGELLPGDLEKAVEKEFEMALQDRVMEETKGRQNAAEAYVYEMRNKLSDKLEELVTPTEKEEFIAKLQEVEDWLYEDGEDETKAR